MIVLGASPGWGAKAPLSADNLKKEATHIVSGKVVSVTSKIQKSTIERSKGIRRDKVFVIKVEVENVTKGGGIKAGEEVTIVAWKPHTRVPSVPGLQGHESIPEKGDAATFYLTARKGVLEPLLPNGIDIAG